METFMTQKKNQYDKIAADAASAQKEHVDALMQSGKIAMEGMEDIFKTCIALTQTMAEKNAQAFKSLIGCKTLNEFTEAHTRVTQTNFDDIMSGATRLSELAVKTATDALEPINEQFTRSMKFANDALAA
jgi:phasin family protein